MLSPKAMIVAQPTWGVDVGAAAFLRQTLLDLSRSGVAILVISEELEELFEISDRIAVLAEQRVITAGAPLEVIAFDHPFVRQFFLGERGQRAMELLREYPFVV